MNEPISIDSNAPRRHGRDVTRFAFATRFFVPAFTAALAETLVATTALALDPAAACERAAGKSLLSCVSSVSRAQERCYSRDGVACTADNVKIVRALDAVARKVGTSCDDDATVQAAGFGPSMTVGSLTARIQSACTAETASLASRSYGGPHGAAWSAADDAGRKCLGGAHRAARKMLSGQAKAQMRCVDNQRGGGSCDTQATADKVALFATKAAGKIAASCPLPDPLPGLIALNGTQLLDRTAAQARCMTAIAHPDTALLALDCGPRAGVPAPPRGSYVQVVLDESEWGTRCGNGAPLAFWIRLAPAGQPVERVVLQMEGGGVCISEADCATRPADLFESLSDNPSQSGIMSNDPVVSPFANWTKVYVPYCTQDIFIGGGATSNFPSITVHRYGAINVRAALRYLRDVLWREMDASTTEGYRPDLVRFLFGGTSAGGFGALYNYHYVLDDLQWAHTAAWPDAALALDNGQPLGVANLGAILVSPTPPLGWNALAQLPPYCFATNCGVGPVLYAASAPRLRAVPEQQFLVLSNQVDNTQVSTTFFPNANAWRNAMRQSYCDTAGTNGLRYFLPAITANTHVIGTRTNVFTAEDVDGIVLRDWLDIAMTDPDSLFDAVEEGTLTTDYPGTNPFPCAID